MVLEFLICTSLLFTQTLIFVVCFRIHYCTQLRFSLLYSYLDLGLYHFFVMAEIENGDKSQTKVELQSVHSAYRWNGKKYLKWSQLIKIILKGKSKVNHLHDEPPGVDDTTFRTWDEEDSMIMTWL